MVEYKVLPTFVSRRLNTDLKDFTLDLWKKRGTMKTVKICSGNIDLQEVRFIRPRLYRMCILAHSYTWKAYLQALKLTILQGLF